MLDVNWEVWDETLVFNLELIAGTDLHIGTVVGGRFSKWDIGDYNRCGWRIFLWNYAHGIPSTISCDGVYGIISLDVCHFWGCHRQQSCKKTSEFKIYYNISTSKFKIIYTFVIWLVTDWVRSYAWLVRQSHARH